jgi:hypothetical protein
MVLPERAYPMDDPADDTLQAKAEPDPAGNRTIVRRIEITVEREITTLIVRPRDERSGTVLPLKPPAHEDSDNSL